MLATNISVVSTRAARTRRRLSDSALRLFVEQGYDATTVSQIADSAGVAAMTFFRHFPTKEDVLVGDPFDPVIADAVTAQPVDLPPFERARRGVLHAWATIHTDAEEVLGDQDTLRLRLRLIAGHPGLRARMWEAQHVTQQAIADALRAGGTSPVAAQAAAGACVGGLVWTLLSWPDEPGRTFGSIVLEALNALGPTESAPRRRGAH